MHKCWPTTIFVLNLAVADLLYCLVVVPLTAVQFYEKGWKWGKFGCFLSGIIKYGVMTVEWSSVALIALTKCINLLFPTIGLKLFSGWNGFAFLIFFWIFTILWYFTPVYFLEVRIQLNQNVTTDCQLIARGQSTLVSAFCHLLISFWL